MTTRTPWPLAALLVAPAALAQMDHSAHMQGALGPYPMSREASGTSWQPDASPMDGAHHMSGDWMFMVHGFADLVYDDQGGPRGDEKVFVPTMLMLMDARPLGPGVLGLRGMLSLDPLMGRSGYPLLLQTGETADGATPLVDRQHPHDFFMELAATYSVDFSGGSGFVYLGLPGEPALGPSTFMHRASGVDLPEAPLSHHWLDSTHITFGVATLGAVVGNREPQRRRGPAGLPARDRAPLRAAVHRVRARGIPLQQPPRAERTDGTRGIRRGQAEPGRAL